jgi:tetratricopeptide (TPR) repeat protein
MRLPLLTELRRLLRPLSWRLFVILALLAVIGAALIVPGWYWWWANRQFRLAEEAMTRYRYREAQVHVTSYLGVYPHSGPGHLLAARAARQLGDLEGALDHLAECEKVQGQRTPEITLERALIRAQRGEAEAAYADCQPLLERDDPATPRILEAFAKGFLDSYRVQAALDCLERWLSREPDNPQAYFLRGIARELLGQRVKATDDFRKAVELDPEFDQVRVTLVTALLDIDQATEALGHAQQLADRQPNDARVLVLLARCHQQLGQPEAAARVLDRVLAAEPRNASALAARGQAALKLGRPAEAAQWLRQAVTQAPNDLPARYHLQQALVQSGQKEEAQKELERVQKAQADGERLRVLIQGQLSKKPRDPELHYELGRLLLLAGSQEGLRSLQTALELDPQHPATHQFLAEYYERHGNREVAARHRALANRARTAAAAPPDSPNPR